MNFAWNHEQGVKKGRCVAVQAEGRLWRALGILTAAGALRNAVLLLRSQGLPDCAAAYVEAAASAGFGTQTAGSDSGTAKI